MPWEVGLRALVPRRGLRALVARPVTRGRVQALSRLTAPTHGRGFWLALSVAAVAAGFVALIPVIFDRGPPLSGVRRDQQALRRLVHGVWSARVAPAAGQRGRAPVDRHGLRRPAVPGAGPARLAGGGHRGHAGRRPVDRPLRRAVLELRDRRPADVDRRRHHRRDVPRRPPRRPVRQAAVPAGRGQPAARIPRRRDGDHAAQGSAGLGDRRVARRGVRDRRALAFGLATAPASTAPELVGGLLRRGVRRDAHELARGLTHRRAQLALERGPGHGPGCVGLGPAALQACARRARGSLPRARHAARRAAGGRARQGAWRSRSRAGVPGAGRALLPRRPRTARRAAGAGWRPGRRARRARRARAGDAHLRPVARRRSRARGGRRGRGCDHARRRAASGGVPRSGSASCAPRASVSSPRATPSGGDSSATSTTAHSSGWCPWRSSCA